jgi:hypothetical protein
MEEAEQPIVAREMPQIPPDHRRHSHLGNAVSPPVDAFMGSRILRADLAAAGLKNARSS